ncbi:hypothetical protein LJB42_001788 [Komagataella kurtzmanii]|nr:hypothetical protein LJB42_001788 [Komagataella kurtzmanii]
MSTDRNAHSKRSPSILVTDSRQNSTSAPFAGHRLSRNNANRSHPSSGYRDVSVSGVLGNRSDVPSSERRDRLPSILANRRPSRSGRYDDTIRKQRHARGLTQEYMSNEIQHRTIPKLSKTLPTRTSKINEKLVLIPDSDEELQKYRKVHQPFNSDLYVRSTAEEMSKEHRAQNYPRVTAYLVANSFDLKLTAKYLEKEHLVSPRRYSEVLYVPYSLPLIPGLNGVRVRSNDSEKVQAGKIWMENYIDKSEQKDHHYEYYSGVEYESDQAIDPQGRSVPLEFDEDHSKSAEFDPSEPQFFPENSLPRDTPIEPSSEVTEEKDTGTLKTTISNESQVPDLSKHAEVFIFDYGTVVFWNLSELNEKNILADLVFAKIRPGEYELSDDEDEDEDDEMDGVNHTTEAATESTPFSNSYSPTPYLPLAIKPVSEQYIETEEFHFEYNVNITTPRIYNDMITLKSGDHMIKLAISHALAQSNKLSLFESRMSVILTSISRLPKALALTGKLANYTRKKVLIKTGKLFQLRNEVNLSSTVLDTPEFFWSFEPALHPLYNAIRDYLEIEQRVEVVNDRCKVFLDFFDMVADSLVERKGTRFIYFVIVAIGMSVIVGGFEILIRYLLIKKNSNSI